MNDRPTNKQQIEPTKEEIKHLEALRKNPIFGTRLTQLTQQFEEEIANGMDAHEAEEALIEALQTLGSSMMSQWAQNTQDQAIEGALENHPSINKHTKKNSSGIAPSD